ncbi:lectin like domain-containing protein [Rubneribacter sp.]|nr:hypothetical protein [Candidatus Rubneribacter avistercoris]
MRNERRSRSLGRCTGCAVVSVALAAAMAGVPSAALAEEPASATPQVASTMEGDDVFAWASGASAANALSEDVLPTQFDLRNNSKFGNVVTPVKFQNPWGSCWSFGIASASEASIISEAAQKGIPLKEEFKDISERHLAWFTYTPLPADDDSGQGGEGVVSLKEGDNGRLDSGGWMVYGTSLFSSGIGPVPESAAPYKNDEGLIDSVTDPVTGKEYNYQYSKDGTWAVDEGLRFWQMVEFEQSVQLPSPGEYNAAEDYEGAKRANDAIKEQLHEGRGVAIAFYADQSKPNQITEMGYMNPGNNEDGSWAHYTYDAVGISHAVTIVGWDDNYAKENFGNPDPETGEVDPNKQPPANGAWIVKNSWGAGDKFPNGYPGGWGTDEDGDGNGDGYFYLSYWDKTITKPESFDFAVESTQSEGDRYFVHQYDYMPAQDVVSNSSALPMKMANIFSADDAETVRKLTCETTRPNTQVTFDVYLLEEGATLPTEGVKLATVQQTFEWGGFHAVELAAEQAFTLNAGERFSVVVTQQCLDDNDYYVSYDVGWDRASLDAFEQQYHEQYYETYYQTYLGVAKDALWQATYNRLIEEGASEEEATAKANEYVETEKGQQQIADAAAKAAEEMIQQRVPSYYYEGVVNEGESFVYASDENGENPAWRDFHADSVASEARGNQIDNLPIKAYGYPIEEGADKPATEESVAQLGVYLSSAKAMLESAVESVAGDGSDVPASQYWVPSDVRAELVAAIMEAEDLLAGGNPTQGDVDRISLALSMATRAFDEAKQPGTLADEYASAEAVKQLEDAIKDARNDLVQTVVSADGSDVAKGTPWVTQATHDAFKAAIASAEAVLGAERPLASDIERAAADLAAAQKAFDAAKADGLKETGGSGGGSEEKPDVGSDAKGNGALVRTGDDALLGIAVACVGGLSALVAGASLAMRRRIGKE